MSYQLYKKTKQQTEQSIKFCIDHILNTRSLITQLGLLRNYRKKKGYYDTIFIRSEKIQMINEMIEIMERYDCLEKRRYEENEEDVAEDEKDDVINRANHVIRKAKVRFADQSHEESNSEESNHNNYESNHNERSQFQSSFIRKDAPQLGSEIDNYFAKVLNDKEKSLGGIQLLYDDQPMPEDPEMKKLEQHMNEKRRQFAANYEVTKKTERENNISDRSEPIIYNSSRVLNNSMAEPKTNRKPSEIPSEKNDEIQIINETPESIDKNFEENDKEFDKIMDIIVNKSDEKTDEKTDKSKNNPNYDKLYSFGITDKNELTQRIYLKAVEVVDGKYPDKTLEEKQKLYREESDNLLDMYVERL
jgi:hypothetical protein